MPDDDRDMREVFRAFRAAEGAFAPPFRRVLAGRQGPRQSRGLAPGILAVGVAVLLAVMLLLSRSDGPSPELELARRVMAWQSATDFLLPADAAGLLSSVPRIGEAPAGSPLQALDPGNVLGPPILPRSPRL